MIDKRPLITVGVLVVVVSVAFFFMQSSNAESPKTQQAVDSPSGENWSDENWAQVIEKITSVENDLFSNPDLTRVGEIMLSTCSCHETTRSRLAKLQSDKQRVDGPNIRIDSVVAEGRKGNDEATVRVKLSSQGKPVVDERGNVVESSPEVKEVGLMYVIVRGVDRQWRIAERGPAPDSGAAK